MPGVRARREASRAPAGGVNPEPLWCLPPAKTVTQLSTDPGRERGWAIHETQGCGMDPVSALEARDGVATFGELMSDGVHPIRLARAVEAEAVARPHRGVYVLPTAFAPFAAAKRLGGTVSHTSAARFHGLELVTDPEVHHVTVPRGRRKELLPGVVIHRRDLAADEELARWPVTGLLRTCLDCLRRLPLREAVVLGDSGLRKEQVGLDQLVTGAAMLRGNRSAAARTAASLLDPRAESALESVARVEMHLAGLPAPEPQVVIETPLGPRRLDFYFREQNVGVETDGFATHGLRRGLLADCERHNAYSLGGVLVVRFGYEHVMWMPSFFTGTVELALEIGALRRLPQCARCGCVDLSPAA